MSAAFSYIKLGKTNVVPTKILTFTLVVHRDFNPREITGAINVQFSRNILI